MEKKYKTKTESFNIAGISLQLKCVTNIDELFEILIQKGDTHEDVKDERIPYWAQLWTSAIALSRHIIEKQVIKKNMNVLEIGCGLGLPGIVAGKFGADVTFTDYLKEPLEMAHHNWILNNDREAQYKIMDWRKPDSSLAADVLLASDVAYEKRSFKYLINAFKKLVNPGGIIILSEPNRLYANEFFDSLKSNGFSFKLYSYFIEENNRKSRVNVYEIKKQETK